MTWGQGATRPSLLSVIYLQDGCNGILDYLTAIPLVGQELDPDLGTVVGFRIECDGAIVAKKGAQTGTGSQTHPLPCGPNQGATITLFVR